MPMNNSAYTENIIHKTGSSPFSLHKTIIEPGQNNALYLHCHPEAELFLLDTGSIDFYIGDDIFKLKPGDGIFIPQGMLHHAVRPQSCHGTIIYYAIVFSTEPMEKCFPKNSPFFEAITCHRRECIYTILSKRAENSKLLSYMREILSLYEITPSSCELSIQGYLFVCWQEIYNLHFSKFNNVSEDSGIRKDLFHSMDYIQEHYSDPLTLEHISKSAGYSVSYYCHSFKHLIGTTPFEYLNRIRIVKSCELLSSTNKKITEIASLVGFNNISYFNRTFYKIMGVTPSAYRKG